jgi:hypothetical protein
MLLEVDRLAEIENEFLQRARFARIRRGIDRFDRAMPHGLQAMNRNRRSVAELTADRVLNTRDIQRTDN